MSVELLFGLILFEGFFVNIFDCQDVINVFEMIDWVVVGGESGIKVWLMYLFWVWLLCD